MIHGSEVAHWESGRLPAGPDERAAEAPETIGGAGVDRERLQLLLRPVDAREVAGREDPDTGGLDVPLFYGWQDNPFNALPFPNGRGAGPLRATVGDPDGGGDDEEPELLEQFGVTLEQLLAPR
jgi:hypothetical protein